MSYYEDGKPRNIALATQNPYDGGVVAHDANTVFDGSSFQEATGSFGEYTQAAAGYGAAPRIYSGYGQVPMQAAAGFGQYMQAAAGYGAYRSYQGLGILASEFDPVAVQALIDGSAPGKPNYGAKGGQWAFRVKAALARLGYGSEPTPEQYGTGQVAWSTDGMNAYKDWLAKNNEKRNGTSGWCYPSFSQLQKIHDQLVAVEAGQPTVMGDKPPQDYTIGTGSGGNPTVVKNPPPPPPPPATCPKGMTGTPPNCKPVSVGGKKTAPAAKSTANVWLYGGLAVIAIAAIAIFAKKKKKPGASAALGGKSEPLLLPASTTATPNRRGRRRRR